MANPFFSIVIPTLNEEKHFPQLLENLANQTFQEFEVVQVDAQSEDQTVKQAQKFKNKLDLKILTSGTKNVGYQRNLGAEKSRADWIVFMDADNSIKPNFLQQLKQQINNNPQVDVFTTWLDVEDYPAKHKPTAQVINFGLELLSKFNPAAFGALIGVKRQVFQQIKFNPNTYYAEDSEFVQSAAEAGYNYVCWHKPRYTYSFRRIEKEGLLKITSIFIEGYVKSFFNGGWEEEFERYPMEGGTYYQEDVHMPFFERIDQFLQTASKKQLKKAKDIWEKIGLNKFAN
jgi:glycosyltransferase involved in cell wall biosynthesis